MKPIKGTVGTIEIGPSGSPVEVAWFGSAEVTVENSTATIGPHCDDANEYEVETSQKWTFKISGTIPEDGDAGQDDLIDATTARTNPRLKVKVARGKVFTFAEPVYKKLSFKYEAKGSLTFEAEGSGPATIAQDPPPTP